jgi:dipeptidyl aminopeptidase/acylaminoacyl peptidase
MSNQATIQPTIEDMISLELIRTHKISPNGDKIAFEVRKTNWKQNKYEKKVFIHFLDENITTELTRTGSSKKIHWVDNNSLAVLQTSANRHSSVCQIHLYENLVGEPIIITNHPGGVIDFQPFAKGFVYKAADPKRRKRKERKASFGTVIHFEQEMSTDALYYVNIEQMKEYQEKQQFTKKEKDGLLEPIVEISLLLESPFSITRFFAGRDGKTIVLNCQPRDDYIYSFENRQFVLQINPDEALENYLEEKKGNNNQEEKNAEKDYSILGSIKEIALPKESWPTALSPDCTKILVALKERDSMLYTQTDLWTLNLVKWADELEEKSIKEKLVKITGKLDREPYRTQWTDFGIYSFIIDHTQSKIIRIYENGEYCILPFEDVYPSIYSPFDIAQNDGRLSFLGCSKNTLWQLFITDQKISEKKNKPREITQINKHVENWQMGTIETISWKSKDGTKIEGVIRKPQNFDETKKYPLLFIIHGGPRSNNFEMLLEYDDLTYYPTIQFVNENFLIVKVNYRGSVGRGQAFTELNKQNLGIGDLWDIESCIAYLSKKELIDESKIGCMGWSQGGYISAFVGLHSNKFKAVSVGAGVADWYTYHVNNDVPYFTTHYLGDSPFRDRTLYHKTAPIANIKQAQTPVLIQHGENDKRVPLANAMELYRGLQEMDVPVELFVYPGMGHPITKPRENYAVLFQNLVWFKHHLLVEKLDFQID